MNMTYAEAITRLAERQGDLAHDIQRKNKQRRTGFVDLYGVEYTRQGDANTPARFYISVSPDLEYYERFQFKLYIQPFATTVTGATSDAEVEVKNTSLSVSDNAIRPNPHRHNTEPHTHTVINGMKLITTTASNFKVSIEGIDVTDYLVAQHDGDWISGEGLYPSDDISTGDDEPNDFYDILDVAGMLKDEGEDDKVTRLLQPGFKPIEISANGAFQVSLINYLKYSHINR